MRMKPQDIEQKSFSIIQNELKEMGKELSERTAPVIMRCIHTSADFSYADTLAFSDGVIDTAVDLLRNGATVVTDTNMALAGIRSGQLAGFGGKAVCFMADESVAKEAKERETTRAFVSMERAAELAGPVVFAIGNAPTALLSLHEMVQKGSYRPAMVVGVPVGFVNVKSAKEIIMGDGIPYIVNRGRKGGSNIAAAIINALLGMAL
ncbi:MAG: precorrin-8X methylmutase [Lachnospiraceae bacterium]|nr:precorrin-8X methylmutase [Lachnospiraceae bacterium]